MRVQLRHVTDTRAAHGMLDQVSATAVHEYPNDVFLRVPHEWVVDVDRGFQSSAEEGAKVIEHEGVRRSCRARSDHLFADRQIDADDPVLKEVDPIALEQSGDDAGFWMGGKR